MGSVIFEFFIADKIFLKYNSIKFINLSKNEQLETDWKILYIAMIEYFGEGRMPRVRILVEYEGTRYFGWQLQKGQQTIQGEIEKALSVIFKKLIRVTGSGRTDTGVHARGQVAHFDIPEYSLDKLQRSLNGILPRDIVIKEIAATNPDFHARFDAIERRYRYYIALKPTALFRNFSWRIGYPLNKTLLQIGAEVIKQVDDFQAFCKVNSEVNHYRCTVFKSHWFMQDERLVYEISANRFLHGMVRAIVGSLIALGSGKIDLGELNSVIQSKDRTSVPLTAPPTGLVLEEVSY